MRTYRILLLILVASIPGLKLSAQLGGLMNKIKKEAANMVKGTSGDVKDPACATDDAIVIYKFAKDEKIGMNEVTFCHTEKGAILIQHKLTKDFFVIKDGKQNGPYQDGDPALNEFGSCNEIMKNNDDLTIKYSDYVFKQGERFVIRFDGKTYGPYDQIQSFNINNSHDKFAASVFEKVLKESDFGDMSKYEKEMQNAKTDAERMQLAQQISQKMNATMMQKGKLSVTAEVVSNIPDINWNPMSCNLNSNIKYNDIVEVSMFEIKDIRGNTIYTLRNQETAMYNNFWLNSDNSRWAGYSNGKIIFSDGKEISEVFAPYLDNFDNRVFLTYMYFSPVKEAIMQVRIPF